ncbi:MAG: TIM barrel protein [Pirellulales bacterium]|nr:TIM barrel protein [Pirellulales bacterium]
MIVAASTSCFPKLSLDAAFDRLVALEYTSVEVVIDERSRHLRPSQVHANLDDVIQQCRQTQRLTPVAYYLDFDCQGKQRIEQFHACCRLAKATKVFTLSVRASELGTPFNEEIERLREFVRLASVEGVLVSIKTETDRMTEDPETALALCQNTPGLGITLDPSHYICGPCSGRDYSKLLPLVHHMQLRDTTPEKLQVRVGQGEIEYGRLVQLLEQEGYHRTLAVDVVEEPDVDHAGELRKLRLLLESLL